MKILMWIQFKICELLTEVEALRQLAYHCTRVLVDGEDMTKEVSMAKLKASGLVCDARLLSIGADEDEIMLGIIAKYEGILTRQ